MNLVTEKNHHTTRFLENILIKNYFFLKCIIQLENIAHPVCLLIYFLFSFFYI